MNTITKYLAIDSANADKAVRNCGYEKLRRFPLKSFINVVAQGDTVDVIEVLITVPKRVPKNNSAEEVATVEQQLYNKVHALEMIGAKTIVCPAKPTPGGGYKQSDDQMLMVKTISDCLRLRPDWLTLVSGDGDMAPMVRELREQGVRVEVVAHPNMVASELKRAANNFVDITDVCEHIAREEVAA